MIRRLTSLLVVVLAVAAVFVATGVDSGSKSGAGGKKFKIAFDNAFGLSEGGDLRVGGVKAGKTKGFDVSYGRECQGATPTDGPPRACAIVEAEITERGFDSLRTDAHCDIRQQSLIGEYYVDCQPGNARGLLPGGATIPDTQTTSTIPADLVGDVMRRPYRERLRLIIAELGTGLAGRPQDVSELLHKAHPGLRETDKVLRILGNQDEIIKNFISDSNTVVRELDQRKRDLQRWVVQASRTSDISASRSEAIAAGFQRLPTFLDELNGTMARLEELTDAQTPLLRELHASAPDLNTFFTRLGPFSEASRPAFRSLGDTADAGKRAFRDSAEEIATLKQLAADAPGAAKPLRQLLEALDDRSRATEKDPRNAETAPPPPDPAAANKGQGLTGMEALLSYAYWQTLALNTVDSIGHVLRGVAIASGTCSEFVNDTRTQAEGGTEESEKRRKNCLSWLGPHQPGINAPDIGKNGTAKTFNGSEAGEGPPVGAKSKGSSEGVGGRGEPEAPPIPGKPDYSKPHPTLPASQQELLDQLGGQLPSPQAPSASVPQTTGSTVSSVLDYLLAP